MWEMTERKCKETQAKASRAKRSNKASSRRSRGKQIHRNASGPCAKRGRSADQSSGKQILVYTHKETNMKLNWGFGR